MSKLVFGALKVGAKFVFKNRFYKKICDMGSGHLNARDLQTDQLYHIDLNYKVSLPS